MHKAKTCLRCLTQIYLQYPPGLRCWTRLTRAWFTGQLCAMLSTITDDQTQALRYVTSTPNRWLESTRKPLDGRVFFLLSHAWNWTGFEPKRQHIRMLISEFKLCKQFMHIPHLNHVNRFTPQGALNISHPISIHIPKCLKCIAVGTWMFNS